MRRRLCSFSRFGVFVGLAVLEECGRSLVGGGRSGGGGARPRPKLELLTDSLVLLAGAIAFAHWATGTSRVIEAIGVVALVAGAHVLYWVSLKQATTTSDLV